MFYYFLIKGYCYTSTEYPIIQIRALPANESIFLCISFKAIKARIQKEQYIQIMLLFDQVLSM